MKPLVCNCKDEREATLACYRNTHGGAPGDVALQCQKVAQELDKPRDARARSGHAHGAGRRGAEARLRRCVGTVWTWPLHTV